MNCPRQYQTDWVVPKTGVGSICWTLIVRLPLTLPSLFVAVSGTVKSVSSNTSGASMITTFNPEIVNQLGALYPDRNVRLVCPVKKPGCVNRRVRALVDLIVCYRCRKGRWVQRRRWCRLRDHPNRQRPYPHVHCRELHARPPQNLYPRSPPAHS